MPIQTGADPTKSQSEDLVIKMPRAPIDSREDVARRLARQLDWNLLRMFIVLARSNSISDAAERLGLTQPAVSAALKRLEDRFGKRLVNRRPGHFALTPAGKKLLEEASEVDGAVRRLSLTMNNLDAEMQGHVTIIMASHAFSPVVDRALTDFSFRHPAATFSIEVVNSRDALALISARRASFAFCLVRELGPRLKAEVLFREYFGLFCGPSHPLFGREGLTMVDLWPYGGVSFKTEIPGVAMMLMAARMDRKMIATSSNLEQLMHLIVAGVGIGPVPLHIAAKEVSEGRLWRLPPYTDPPEVDMSLVWNPTLRMNRAEETLLATIRQQIADTPFEARIFR